MIKCVISNYFGCQSKLKLSFGNLINQTDMDELIKNVSELTISFAKEANLQIEKNNKAAGIRARKISLEIEKLMKQFRKESVDMNK